jgi:phosphoadenosine phosphosulfate reductase
MWDVHTKPIHQKLDEYARSGRRVFVSSSFQTHSIPMLHILSTHDSDIPVYFLDTGFHFPETKFFRDQIVHLLGLNLQIVESSVPKIAQRDDIGRLLFASDPDRCCYINKVLPLEPVLKTHDVWISGVRKDQTQFRSALKEETPGIHNTLRYHPILEWSSRMIWQYIKDHDLPEHPLDAQGYLSIGCIPCTRKWNDTNGDRGARWSGMTKEECGIHTEFTAN